MPTLEAILDYGETHNWRPLPRRAQKATGWGWSDRPYQAYSALRAATPAQRAACATIEDALALAAARKRAAEDAAAEADAAKGSRARSAQRWYVWIQGDFVEDVLAGKLAEAATREELPELARRGNQAVLDVVNQQLARGWSHRYVRPANVMAAPIFDATADFDAAVEIGELLRAAAAR